MGKRHKRRRQINRLEPHKGPLILTQPPIPVSFRTNPPWQTMSPETRAAVAEIVKTAAKQLNRTGR